MMVLNNKDQKEAEATIRKTKEGKYHDFYKDSLSRKGIKNLKEEQFLDLLKKIRLRFSLTPQCNLWCVFCSNEGANYTAKSCHCADINLIIKLSEMLIEKNFIKAIDFSGGEPTMHPDFRNRKFKLIRWTKKYPKIRFSLHSNGIELNSEIVNNIKNNFSRIGVSVNSFDFDKWNKMVNFRNMFPLEIQRQKFRKLINNLNYISRQGIGHKIFVKSVIMKGVNDDKKELQSFLNKCEEYHFHPKFFQFEPQFSEQKKYIVPRQEFLFKLKEIGCKFLGDIPKDNDQKCYIPNINFTYNNLIGVYSFFGCGLKNACESCYDFACIFIKPGDDGRGLYLKPCLALNTFIDLTHAINDQNYEQLLDLIRISREYLMVAPGTGISGWSKEEEFKFY
jgi:molybdenum cofactor biosynthesis enzyme MoaA